MQLLTNFIESKEGLTMIRAQSLTSNGWLNTYYLIDTGATLSLFSPEVCRIKEGFDNITDLKGITLISQKCTAVVLLSDKTMKIDGNVIDYDILPSVDGKRLSGILGVEFLEKNRLILDFFNGGVYLKEHVASVTNEYSFISMNLGLNGCYIPTILLNYNNHQLPFIIDTGATNNMVVPAISYNSVGIKDSESYLIKGLVSSSSAKECELNFYIQMYKKGKIRRYDFSDVFTLIEQDSIVGHSVFNTNYGIIGNVFIQRQKWIIDFSARKIYERQE